jgi:hypothetical protein
LCKTPALHSRKRPRDGHAGFGIGAKKKTYITRDFSQMGVGGFFSGIALWAMEIAAGGGVG